MRSKALDLENKQQVCRKHATTLVTSHTGVCVLSAVPFPSIISFISLAVPGTHSIREVSSVNTVPYKHPSDIPEQAISKVEFSSWNMKLSLDVCVCWRILQNCCCRKIAGLQNSRFCLTAVCQPENNPNLCHPQGYFT